MRLSAAGLNFLYSGGKFSPVPVSVSSVHKTVLRRIVGQLQDIFGELDVSEPVLASKGAFGRVVGRGVVGKYPDLRSQMVDLLDDCARLDPLPILPSEHRATLTSPEQLFPNGTSSLPERVSFTSGPRGEYVNLVQRQVRSGKVSLMMEPSAAALPSPSAKGEKTL